MGAVGQGHTLIILFDLVLVVGPIAGIIAVVVKANSGRRSGRRTLGAPLPGWYPDNAYPAQSRWFDGRQWTDRIKRR